MVGVKMKKIEIHKGDKLLLVTVVTDYEINTYVNSFDIICKNEDIEITYNIPLNKGYKIVADV